MALPIVLFLCTGNSARSQMAEALLRHKAGDRFEACSAGTEPAPAIHPLAVAAMNEIGLDLSAQRPKGLESFPGHPPIRHLILVCDGASRRCPSVLPGVRTRDFWPIADPAAFPLDDRAPDRFRAARDEIASRLDAWLAARGPAGPGGADGREPR